MIFDNHTIKILMVTRETQSDRRYGLGRSLMPLVEELYRRGIEANYLCQTDLGERALLWQQRLQRILSSLPGRMNSHTHFSALLQVLLERFNMGRLAAKLATKQGYTHIHCHDPIIAAGLRFFLRFHPKCRVIWGVTEHGFACYAQAIHEDGVHLGQTMMRIMRKWERSILLAASWVIAPTRSGIHQIAHDLEISPLPENWYHLVHARPVLNHYSQEQAKNLLGWNKDTVYVLAVGRIAPVKQFPLLIEACARFKTKENFQLVILGEGNYDELQKLAQQLDFPRKIILAITENIGLYLCAADLYISASASESFGMANLEALTAGTAAICTAVGGVPEVVGDGALLVESNPDALAEAIERMLNDQSLREAIAQKGQARAKAWPDITEITDRYEEIYRRATR
ncbi:glycosyltransferase family 4 protein [Nitrosomonas sp. Nm166]|uniref:glycosyltransferase family 4 protein n=1 Tax=Nitrosomonas sp. Nm166 TaxID=1881054 RepID=UPI0008F0D0EE|nr:glycosyltransferase family 4 protein [Nitrosomonas sp. Nm166]SFE96465.1 Glycosyltransferase involved in cell wall bisynthesis [Nitrosomonas sp. Nm166]